MWRPDVLTLTIAVLATIGAAGGTTFVAPDTPRRPVMDVLHGVTLTDGYRWLENGADPEVAAWTRAQHAATVRFLDRAAPAIPGLKDELTRYFDRDKTDPPLFKHGREFFQRARRGEPQSKLFDSGHGTGKTRQQRVVDRDYELRFLLNALGVTAR